MASDASANVVVSNLDENERFTAVISGSTLRDFVNLAAKFTTGTGDLTVTGASALLTARLTGTEPTTTYVAELWTSAGITPDTLIASSAPSTEPGVGTSPSSSNTIFDFTFAGVDLEANTDYWISFRGIDTSATGVRLTDSDDESFAADGWSIDDTGFARITNDGGSWADASGPNLGWVPIFSITAVPAPGAVALLGGAGVLAARRRRVR
ncbi:MAG: choice-of-anchor R domain-containing protein [Planctomycetota bacterium]